MVYNFLENFNTLTDLKLGFSPADPLNYTEFCNILNSISGLKNLKNLSIYADILELDMNTVNFNDNFPYKVQYSLPKLSL